LLHNRCRDRFHPAERTIKDKQDMIVQAITLLVYVLGAAMAGMWGIHFLLNSAIISESTIGIVPIVAWIRLNRK
jgi:hypothetical protein